MFPVFHISKNAGQIISSQHKQVPRSIPTHWHDCMEVELVLSGSGTHTINGISLPIRPGDFYLLTPLDHHGLEVQQPLEVCGIMFTETLLDQELRKHILALSAQGNPLGTRLPEKELCRIRQLFEMSNHNNRLLPDQSFYHQYMGNLLGCILIELIRSLESHIKAADTGGIRDLILYISQHYTEPISLNTLAQAVHLNASYVSRLFRQSTGLSYSQYLIDLRLRHAGRLLATTKSPVTEVCFSSGFHDYAHFARSFKKHFGISPTQFRAQNNNFKEKPL